MFDISPERSKCSMSPHISVTVSSKGTKNGNFFQSESQLIGLLILIQISSIMFINYADSVNDFIHITFDKVTSSIILKFINQPKVNKKTYSVMYGPKSAECVDLPLHTEGYLSNSNLISLSLNLNLKQVAEICFSVVISNGSKTVSVKGIYKLNFGMQYQIMQ